MAAAPRPAEAAPQQPRPSAARTMRPSRLTTPAYAISRKRRTTIRTRPRLRRRRKSPKAYRESLEYFIDAVGADPKMYQAWNYLGFANRHLGNYADSLSSYAKALEINPNYPDAIEYRGEAYLGLNRIEDAKGAYMALFRDSRPLADELMAAMHRWADAHRQDPQGLSSADVEAFSKWIDERTGIAGKTASLGLGAGHPWSQGSR